LNNFSNKIDNAIVSYHVARQSVSYPCGTIPLFEPLKAYSSTGKPE